jgi:hypothetical protein
MELEYVQICVAANWERILYNSGLISCNLTNNTVAAWHFTKLLDLDHRKNGVELQACAFDLRL